LAESLAGMKKNTSQLEYKLGYGQDELQRVNIRLTGLEKEVVDRTNKCEQYEALICRLNEDKENMIDNDTYDQLQEEVHIMKSDFESIKYSRDSLIEQIHLVTHKEKGNETKLSELNQHLIQTVNELENVSKERDLSKMELKTLSNIKKQKESIITELEKDKEEEYEKVKNCQNITQKLKNEREGLINDNSMLIEDNKNLQNNIIDLKQFIGKLS
jgi:chromosome segregation ATPase